MKYPLIKNKERYGPRVTNGYSKYNAFWTQVFKAYDEFHNKIKLTNAGEVLSEPVCFNQSASTSLLLMHKHWIDMGVHCVAHFLNEEGKILSHIDFQRKFDITIDCVTYSGCKLCKNFFYNNNVMNLTACLHKLYETNMGCKLYYDVLNQSDVKSSCCSKWQDKLQRNLPWQSFFHQLSKIQNLPWQSFFHQLSKIHDSNMKWFQMRIMHRIIGTNVILNEMGVTNNNKNSFCLIAKDTIQHIFWECTHSQQF